MNKDAVIKALLEVLRKAEWVDDEESHTEEYMGRWCPWCGNWEHHGHDQKCEGRTAITLATEATHD